MEFFTYVLVSEAIERRYVGSCQNLENRISRHNQGESIATRHGVPWRLVHSESFPTRSEAIRRELYFKTGAGRDELVRIVG